MQINIIGTFDHIVKIIFIGCPSKVMHHWSIKMPSQGFGCIRIFNGNSAILITVTNFIWILQITRATQNIFFVNSDFYVKIAPNTLKFPSDVGISMPTFKIKFGYFWIPLCHRQCYSFSIIPAGTTNLHWNLTLKIKCEGGFRMGQNWLSQSHFKNGSHCFCSGNYSLLFEI